MHKRSGSTCFSFAGALVTATALLLGSLSTHADELSDQARTRVATGELAGVSSEGLTEFKGIPFAAPPTGNLRWAPPQPPSSWDGVREAKSFAPACMQLQNPMIDIAEGAVNEDCLYLNVWTPASSKDEKLPVVVWIHGGGFSFGASSQKLFNGAALARKGVVFVSPTYRLGPFGFLAHPALSAESDKGVSGNYGILDQVAALQWVQQNVAAFGGDPERVTIMGESAGAFSVSILAASPLARGLFHQVIAESGASFNDASDDPDSGSNLMTLAAAERKGKAWADSQGLQSTADLRGVSAQTVLETMPRQSLFVLDSSWPLLDGYVMADNAIDLYTAGQQNDTPVLLGWNADEGSLFVQKSSLEEYRNYVEKRFGNHAPDVFDAYPATDDQQALEARRDVFRDEAFGWPVWTWANLQTQTGEGQAYVYYFNQSPPPRPGRPDFGATHAMEMFYVFKNLMPIMDWTDVDRDVSEAMSSYWINFIKTGDPNDGALPQWPQWERDAQTVMLFENGARSATLPDAQQIRVMDNFFNRRAD